MSVWDVPCVSTLSHSLPGYVLDFLYPPHDPMYQTGIVNISHTAIVQASLPERVRNVLSAYLAYGVGCIFYCMCFFVSCRREERIIKDSQSRRWRNSIELYENFLEFARQREFANS